MNLRIVLGADHGGFVLKNELFTRLRDSYVISDLGAHAFDATDDYADFALSSMPALPVRKDTAAG